MVHPWFCGKTYLERNKLLLSEVISPNRKIKALTRYPSQSPDYDTEEGVSTIDEYNYCVVVSDDMLENEQKKISHFFTRGKYKNNDVNGIDDIKQRYHNGIFSHC